MRTMLVLLWIFLFAYIPTVQAQKITVLTEEYPPYNFTENNVVTGCATEIVQQVLKRADIAYTITSYPWARTYRLAQIEPNVLIYSIGRTKEREELFKWVGVVAPYDIFLYKVKTRTDVQVKNLEEAKRYKTGAVRDDVRAQYLERAGFAIDTSLELVAQDILNIKKLLAGRIDLIPFDKQGLTYIMKKNNLNIDDLEPVMRLDDLSSGLYLAFSLQTDDATVKTCTKALAEIKADGTYDRIMRKWEQ